MAFPAKTRRIREPLPWLVDEIAKAEPTRAFASIPKVPTDLSAGYRDISFRQTARAINRYCGFIEKHIGRNESNSNSVVCYIGMQDPRCHFITLALQKLGHTVLMSAPRNSLQMHLNIFDQTGCHTLIHDKAVDPKQVVGGRDMKTLVGPTMDEILDDDAGEPTQYPFTKTWDEIKRKPLCVLHTSGSTGMPKPIYISHEYTASGAEIQYIPEIDGHMTLLAEYIRVPGRRIYVTFPPFHVGGLIVVGFATIIYANTCNVLGPPHLPPMADVVLDVMKHGNVKCLLTIPAPLMDLSKSKEGMEWMGKLDWIIYGGGTVDKVAGDAISKVTHLQSILGSTECNLQGIQFFNNPDERHLWDYFPFVPNQAGVEFEERSPGIFEMKMVREPSSEDVHPVWKTFPQYSEYLTRDLLSRHPDPKYASRWKFESRTDDLIAFANAGKYNSLAFEEYMVSNPIIRSAVMAGAGRPFASLILELFESVPKDSQRYQELIEQVWPTVQSANLDAPKHAHIRREMILLATPDKPFDRAAKGTVVKGRTLKLYDSEIDALYKAYFDKAPAAAIFSAAAANVAVAQEHAPEQGKGNDDSLARTNELLAQTNEKLSKMTETMGKLYDMFARMEATQARMSNGAPKSPAAVDGSAHMPVGLR